MNQFIIKFVLTLLATSIVFLQPATAVKIVRLELEYGSDVIASGGFDIPKTNKTLDLELYDDVTPVTVANYLSYVNNGLYDLTFINRSIPGFVLQTGGLTNISGPVDPIVPGTGPDSTFIEVPASSPIINEPGLSNIRGTIAMARLDGQPDSATSEWFINLKDNSDSLDDYDGGFTVFGSIIDDGMETADQIAAFPILNVPFIISDLPIADADPNPDPEDGPADPFVQSNLVMTLSATEINRPIMRFTPAVGNFGFESLGNVAGKIIDVVVKNTGNEILDITPNGVSSISSPFSIESEDCSNASLLPVSTDPTSSCTVSLQFLPTKMGESSGDFSIDYAGRISDELFSVKYHLSATGAFGIPENATTYTFDAGTSQVDGYSTTKDILIGNNGQNSLNILEITGLNQTDFSQTNNCVDSSVVLSPGETCTITVRFETSDLGEKSAILSIKSDDLLNDTVDIVLSGFGDNDADGITSEIEDAAPNAGDNNFDGIIDSLQNNVASFISKTGDYISLMVDSSNVVTSISANQLIDLPADVEFKHGVLEFDVAGVAISSPGAIIQVGLVLPVGSGLQAYYFFGETADNATPHWYRYEPVQILANTSPGNRDRIVLTVQDGGTGDADQTVNGRIRIAPGAPAYSMNSSDGDSGSSAMNLLFLGIFAVMLITLQRRYR